MKKLLRPIILCLIAFTFCRCKEDTVEPDVFGLLYGNVVLESDNSPVANVTISTNPPTSTIETDNSGGFAFENLKVGTYTIRAELAGFVTAIESVSIFEDQTATVTIKLKPANQNNNPPTLPVLIAPINGDGDQDISVMLRWSAEDEDEDTLTYDVYLFNSTQNPNTLIANDLETDSLVINDLKFGTTYFWQVAVKDGKSDPVFGEVWAFSTEAFPNHPWVFSKVNNGKYDIFAAEIANGAYRLTEQDGSNYRPRISPDGNRIAFLSNIFPNTQLFTMKRDGSEVTLVPAPIPVDGDDKFELDFAWSPDGTKLLFMNENKLFRINLDGSGFELFAELPDAEFIEVAWTPIGNKIAARCVGTVPYESKILLYDVDGNFIAYLVDDDPGSLGGPVFSVDGNSILYTYDVSGFEVPEGRQLDAHIFMKNINTGVVTDLSVEKEPGFNDLDPRFSPNGALVIFVETNNAPNSPKNIVIMNLEGEGRTPMFLNAEMPDWH